jgi:hypothetical protein
MEEEVIDYLYNWATSDGFKKSKEDFVKLLQTNDEVLSYAFDFAQKDGFKKDKNALGLLVGRTATAAPVATIEPVKTEQTTIEPAKTEPAKTEPAKTEPTTPIATAPAKTEVATTIPVTETKPTVTPEPEKMQVKSVEPTPTKEEPMTAEKKEIVKSDIESSITTIPEKTEVKAIETPSDKMVIKSETKAEAKPTEVAKVEVKEMKEEEPKMKIMTKEEKKEWQCPPSEGGCPKNKDVVHNYFDEKYKDKDYTPIIDREGNLAKFIDDGARGVPITEYYGRKSYTHDSYGFTYSAEELPKSERFSVYNVPIEGKETSLIYDNKTGVIMKDTGDAIKTEDGKQMKTWLDVPMNNPEYIKLKEDIEKTKAGKSIIAPPTISTGIPVTEWQKNK